MARKKVCKINYDLRRLIAKDFGERYQRQTPCNHTEKRFFKFHKDNPHIWQKYVKIVADEVISRGFHSFSSTMVINQLRWLHTMKYVNDDSQPFRLDDGHAAYYSRLFNWTYSSEIGDPMIGCKIVKGEHQRLMEVPGVTQKLRETIIDALKKGEKKK